jgi:hypothetical protein
MGGYEMEISHGVLAGGLADRLSEVNSIAISSKTKTSTLCASVSDWICSE